MSQTTDGPKLLRRSRTDRYVGGVCGGVADYLNMDPTLVRVLTAVLTLVTGGAPVVLYLVALFFMPEADVTAPVPPSPVGQAGDPVWGADGPPWAQTTAAQPPASTWTAPATTPATTAATTAAPFGEPSDPPRRDDGL